MSDHEHPLFARVYDPVMKLPERAFLGEHREYLTAGATGTVLDLGAGTGAQFGAFEERGDAIEEVHAVEPDPHMRRQAVEEAHKSQVDIKCSGATAESLPYDDDTFQRVVASFVFCTIPDTEAALEEVCRVLAPDGEFRFVEHVRGDGVVGVTHDVCAPAWHTVAGGCHLNRETGEQFLSEDRFEPVEYERFESGVSRLLPVVRGRMRRRNTSSVSRWIRERLPG